MSQDLEVTDVLSRAADSQSALSSELLKAVKL